MANPDHTAPGRPSVPAKNGPKSAFFPEESSYARSLAAATKQTRAAKLAGSTFASVYVSQLLLNSHDYRGAKARGEEPEAGYFPLTQGQANGLHAALHYLRLYIDELDRRDR